MGLSRDVYTSIYVYTSVYVPGLSSQFQILTCKNENPMLWVRTPHPESTTVTALPHTNTCAYILYNFFCNWKIFLMNVIPYLIDLCWIRNTKITLFWPSSSLRNFSENKWRARDIPRQTEQFGGNQTLRWRMGRSSEVNKVSRQTNEMHVDSYDRTKEE